MYGSAWWSWVVCSGLIGFIMDGLVKINLSSGQFSFKNIVFFNVAQVIGNIVCWAIAPILDILIYSEPANKVFTQGILSATLDIIAVGIIGTILLKACSYSN